MPDETLLNKASTGELSKGDSLTNETKRLLNSSTIREFADNFAGQWLQLRSLDRLQIDKKTFPEWNEDLKDSFKNETVLFFEHVLKNNLSIREFIKSDKIFVNEVLAKHYDIKGITGKNFRAVPSQNRGGILTMASVLAVTSMPARTSPVKRGKWVLEEVLGTPPPPPPEDISPLEEDSVESKKLTFREKLELHRDSDDCRGCHNRMDPIGFSFEHYDAIGKWRDMELGKPIDAGGTTPDGVVLKGTDTLQSYILAKEEKFISHLIGKLIIYSAGRGLEEGDYKTINNVITTTKGNGYRFQDIIIEIVNSPTFRLKKP